MECKEFVESICAHDSCKRSVKYHFDLVELQEVRWDGDCTKPANEYAFFCGRRNGNLELGIFFKIGDSHQQLRG
jgi:hypothetical protein